MEKLTIDSLIEEHNLLKYLSIANQEECRINLDNYHLSELEKFALLAELEDTFPNFIFKLTYSKGSKYLSIVATEIKTNLTVPSEKAMNGFKKALQGTLPNGSIIFNDVN